MRSMVKWPDVPDVHGWLRLDRRGNWRIRTDSPGRDPVFGTVGNVALRDFIARNYAADNRGRWYFQNGPQRVFVQLAYAPYVFRIDGSVVSDHCGRQVGAIDGAWVDEEGSLLLGAGGRIGLLDDRDLALLADQVASGELRLDRACIAVGSLAAKDVEGLFGFVRNPGP
jgi:hypothetical protein